MAEEKVYAEGVRTFAKREGSPDFVLGTVIIEPRTLTEWIKANPQHLSDYNGVKQLKLNALNGTKGLYLQVDTFKPDPNYKAAAAPSFAEDEQDLPFK